MMPWGFRSRDGPGPQNSNGVRSSIRRQGVAASGGCCLWRLLPLAGAASGGCCLGVHARECIVYRCSIPPGCAALRAQTSPAPGQPGSWVLVGPEPHAAVSQALRPAAWRVSRRQTPCVRGCVFACIS